MVAVLARRVLMAIPILVIVSVVMFVLASIVPGDQARTILGENATPQAVAALREQLGLNLPLSQQYLNWAWGALRGDFGASIYSGQSVLTIVGARFPVTGSLMLLATILIAVLGGILGMLSALRGGWIGRVLDAASLVGLAVPSFAIAILLVSVFAVSVRIFPATGYVPFSDNPAGWLWALILPVIALSLGGVTLVAKQMRDSVLDALSRDYVRMMRANGIPERSIIFRHVLKNASIPSITIVGVGAVASLTSTVFVENVFVLPGLGTLATQSTLNHDLPVLLGLGVFFTMMVILINLVVDVMYGVLNPKVRIS
ncbi:ABC transporter permease [Paramicrobacterium fandaimingii]|uniref:ABC transporter permease n=1 Tax=Paramicrobacterium fandaimingii TaxID=2708079 RepID=UPI0014247628|nr:ABC transporter permease [Microbacterium fandaimingii]